MKKIFLIFVIAFILNAIWENFHSLLYASYQGGSITEFILLRASLADALMITIIALPFIFLASFKRQSWIIVPIGLILAVAIEWYGLGTGRWAYNALMPIIPFLDVGLTPTIQLGLLGYLSFRVEERILENSKSQAPNIKQIRSTKS